MKIKLFHGAGALFSKFRQEFSRSPNDHYGGGLAYLTTDEKIARGYATSSAKRTKSDPIIYLVEANFKKVFDIDETFTGKEMKEFLPKDIDGFARSAKIAKFSSDGSSLMLAKSKLRDGTIELTGRQIYDGLSGVNNNQTSKVRDIFISMGYDALRYNGGLNMMTTSHDVYIAYKATTLKILSSENMNKKESFKDFYKNIQHKEV